jgi:lactonase
MTGLRPERRVFLPAIAFSAAALLAGCGTAPPSPETAAAGEGTASVPAVQKAQRVMQVTPVHQATGMTLLEGPTFGPDGSLYLVDVTAPPGAGKVLRIDTGKKIVSTVYTDDGSALTSAQFHPQDGRLYVTDFRGGAVLSMEADGRDVQEVFSGPVDGRSIQPDDISFDPAGNLYITDATGARSPHWDAMGRIIRVDGATHQATALADRLESPNGIAFSPDNTALWISLNTGNRIDHLTLTPDGTAVAAAFPAIYASVGQAQVDSLAVDAGGNLYVGLHNSPKILIYEPDGTLVQTIEVPAKDKAGLGSATNIAIRPGTTQAYATISGPDGGFLYSFRAIGEGIPQSNGG